jgi:hypothetical protein
MAPPCHLAHNSGKHCCRRHFTCGPHARSQMRLMVHLSPLARGRGHSQHERGASVSEFYREIVVYGAQHRCLAPRNGIASRLLCCRSERAGPRTRRSQLRAPFVGARSRQACIRPAPVPLPLPPRGKWPGEPARSSRFTFKKKYIPRFTEHLLVLSAKQVAQDTPDRTWTV